MSVDPVSALPSRPSPGAAGARLGELYAAHARMVYGVCRMLLRDVDDAEDATQQVFLSAYRNLLTGTEVRDPAAWLGTIARNACRRRASDRMREPLALGDEPTLVSPAADETAIGREDAAALYAQLAVLPEKQREAVILRDLFGLRYDEVAKALGTSRPAVEALVFRGRRRLQRRLRPGLVAGVLVVPLAVQESIAYAVPGFATTAAPAGAAAAAAGIPLVAKLAAAGSAVAIAGSAGVVAERTLHDPPSRPSGEVATQVEPVAEAHAAPQQSGLLPVPAGGSTVVRSGRDDRSAANGDGRAAAGGDEDDEDDDEKDGDQDDERHGERSDDLSADEDEKDDGDLDDRRLETDAADFEDEEDEVDADESDDRADADLGTDDSEQDDSEHDD